MPSKLYITSSLNVFFLHNLKINQRSYYNLPNSVFEADFLWKDSLEFLKSGIILKTFTHDTSAQPYFAIKTA